MCKHLRIYTDGSYTAPDLVGFGYAAYDAESGSLISRYSGYLIASSSSCNYAEYMAIYKALEWAMSIPDLESILLSSDSLLCMKQLAGHWRVRGGVYRSVYEEVRSLIGRLQRLRGLRLRVRWIPREENQEADALSRETLRASRNLRGSVG